MRLPNRRLALGGPPARQQGSDTRGSAAQSGASIALDGYCAVCIIEMKKWVRGTAEHQVTFDGKVYFFPGADQKQMFLAAPAKYVPALGGDCTVCYAKMGQRMPGSLYHAAFFRDRLFLFPGADQKAEFVNQPAAYADVDLAMGGNCAVCQVEMNQAVAGDPQFTVIHQGMRYLFPGAKQRDMFLADPAKYAVSPPAGRQTRVNRPAGKATQLAVASGGSIPSPVIRVSGKSGCAACDHGVHPLQSESELGLAVSADDGTVYIVEEAHRLYPQVYEKRFDSLHVRGQRQGFKRDAEFVWLEPSELRIIN